MLISIIIPVYNVVKYIKEGLNSIVNQTYQNLDVICINDGSTDGSCKILEEYAIHDSRIRIITQENKGTFIARQRGVSAAKGEYILFFDPDDWLELNAIEKIVQFINQTNTDIVQYDAFIESENIETENIKHLDLYLNTKLQCINGKDAMYVECFEQSNISWNLIGKVVRASVCKQAFSAQEPIEFSTSTDYLAMFYIYTFSCKLEHLPLKLYHYRYGVGVSTKPHMQLDDFKNFLKNAEGYYSLRRFVENNEEITLMGKRIVNYTMRDFTLKNNLYHAINRLDKNIKSRKWLPLYIQAMGEEEEAIYAIADQIDEYKSEINVCKNEIKEMQESVISQEKIITSLTLNLKHQTLKNKKHLLLVRLLFLLCLLSILVIIIEGVK